MTFRNAAFAVLKTGTITVTVLGNPAVTTAASSATVCAGTATNITASGAASYTWMPGWLNGPVINVAPEVTTTYTVTGMNGPNCAGTATRTITVNPRPNVAVTASQTLVCPSATVVLTASGANTYNWMPGNFNGAMITVLPAVTTTYTVTGTTTASGCTRTATITVNIMNVTTTGVPATVCAGNQAVLTASGAITYNWMPGNFNGATYTVTPATTTTYTVTGSNGAGCTRTATRTITVNPAPPVTVTASQVFVCPGTAITLTATGANTYTLMPGGNTGSTFIVTPFSSTTYTITGTNTTTGCTASVMMPITIMNVNVMSSPVEICLGSSSVLTASGAISYTWMPGGATGSSYTVTPTSTTLYTVTGSNGAGCTRTATIWVEVNQPPLVASITASQTSICAGNAVTLTAFGGTTHSWMPGGLSGNPIIVTPLATTIYTVTAATPQGCTKTATRTITVSPCTNSVLSIKSYVEGYWNGTDLAPVLSNQGLTVPSNVCDTVIVELHNSSPPYQAVHTYKTLLYRSGMIVCNFLPLGSTPYYIVVRHRNALQTWSASAVSIGANLFYDFTTGSSMAYGNNMREISPGKWACYSGDVVQDESIDLFDLLEIDNDAFLFLSGYLATDINGDGNVDLLDLPLVEDNVNSFLFSSHP